MKSVAAIKTIPKLFVGNLPWTIGNKELKLYFSKFGYVSSATVIFDKNCGMSRGYGFVLYGSRDGYNSAANKQTHTLEGRCLSIEPAAN